MPIRVGKVRVGVTYCTWSVQFQKWWYRTVVAITHDQHHPGKQNVSFVQHYGELDCDGYWRCETTRLTSFARWAERRAKLPHNLLERTPIHHIPPTKHQWVDTATDDERFWLLCGEEG